MNGSCFQFNDASMESFGKAANITLSNLVIERDTKKNSLKMKKILLAILVSFNCLFASAQETKDINIWKFKVEVNYHKIDYDETMHELKAGRSLAGRNDRKNKIF